MVLLDALTPPISRSIYDYILRSPHIDRLLDSLQERQLIRNLCRPGHSPNYTEREESITQVGGKEERKEGGRRITQVTRGAGWGEEGQEGESISQVPGGWGERRERAEYRIGVGGGGEYQTGDEQGGGEGGGVSHR